MLDDCGEETEDTEGDKTQSENQGGVNVVAGSVNKSTFNQNIPEFSDAKPKPNQRETGANPRHEGSVAAASRVRSLASSVDHSCRWGFRSWVLAVLCLKVRSMV